MDQYFTFVVQLVAHPTGSPSDFGGAGRGIRFDGHVEVVETCFAQRCEAVSFSGPEVENRADADLWQGGYLPIGEVLALRHIRYGPAQIVRRLGT